MDLIILADKRLQAAATELARSEHIMTLAVAGRSQPWAAPVYYIYASSSFWFFSSPEAVHICDALPAGRAAASIHAPSKGWKDIRGLQMDGIIEAASSGPEAAAAFVRYMQKFSFISELMTGAAGSGGNSTSLTPGIRMLEEAFRAKWYRFVPLLVYYLDNSVSFGSRSQVELG